MNTQSPWWEKSAHSDRRPILIARGRIKAAFRRWLADRYGNVHVPVGKASFEVSALVANVKAVLDELVRSKPAAAKGRYMKRITLSSTMSPAVRIDPSIVE